MEEALGVKYDKRGQLISKRAVVRYADDFVVFCETQEDADQVKQTLSNWLQTRGLTLSAEKTRVVHLSEGFDFLGFNIRHYKSSLARSGWKLLIKPSKQAVQKLRENPWDAQRDYRLARISLISGVVHTAHLVTIMGGCCLPRDEMNATKRELEVLR
jgi:RNA-directed DNA polymerase